MHDMDTESTASSIENISESSQLRGNIPNDFKSSTFQRMYMCVHANARLFAAIICFLLAAFMVYGAYLSRANMNSAIVLFWVVIAVLVPLISGINYVYTYMKNGLSLRVSIDSDAAQICTVELCINNETVLTVRSWWPVSMTKSHIGKNGVRVAMAAANRWLEENSQPGGKVIRVRFDEESATHFCKQYICSQTHPQVSDHAQQCSVCLEDIEHGVAMKHCGHVFHQDCLSSWFSQSSRLVCPMCRCDHHSCVPQSVYMQFVMKEEPSVSVLTIHIEEGTLA
jgi:hypothetical protein